MKKYEGEFPKKYFKDFLKYLDINEKHFLKAVDKWRPNHLWVKKNKKWIFKQRIK